MYNVFPVKERWIIRFSRFGIAMKGVVYCILGLLTILVVLHQRQKQASKEDVFKTILEQPLGEILLMIVAAGLLCFAIWRIVQTVKDPYRKGKDWKGILIRAGYLWSAMIYLSITVYAGTMALHGEGSGKSGDSKKMMVNEIMQQPHGRILVGLIAGEIILFGLYQIYKGLTGKFMKHIRKAEVQIRKQKLYQKVGSLGYSSRGIVFSIIGFLFIQAALQANPSKAQGEEGAFNLLSSSFGPWILGLVAAGLIAYGMFMFVKVKYADVHT